MLMVILFGSILLQTILNNIFFDSKKMSGLIGGVFIYKKILIFRVSREPSV